jgi:hypothetical protein
MPLLDHGENIGLNMAFTLTLGPLLILGVAWGTLALPRRVASKAARWVLWVGGGIAWGLMILLGLAEGAITGLYPPATLGVMLGTYVTILVPVGLVALAVGARPNSQERNKEAEVTRP